MKNKQENPKILVTGVAGFVGSNLAQYLIERTKHHVVSVDKLTDAGNLQSRGSIKDNPRSNFFRPTSVTPIRSLKLPTKLERQGLTR